MLVQVNKKPKGLSATDVTIGYYQHDKMKWH